MDYASKIILSLIFTNTLLVLSLIEKENNNNHINFIYGNNNNFTGAFNESKKETNA